MDNHNNNDSFNFFDNFCSETESRLKFNDTIRTKKKENTDIDLLITYNHKPRLSSIISVYHYYRDHFRNIIFCGEEFKKVFIENKSVFQKFDSYTLIDIKDAGTASFVYVCTNNITMFLYVFMQ